MNTLFKPFQPTITESGLKRFSLTCRYSRPCRTLKGIVHSYLQIIAEKPTPYPVMPDGSQSIYISPKGSIVGGAQLTSCDIQILEPGEYFGIRFYPGALRYFFNLDLFEITGQFVDEKFLPCRTFGDLHRDIYRYQCFRERVEICEKWLLTNFKLQSISQFDQALGLIYQSLGNMKISQLAGNVGWSTRHLNRVFQRHTGLSTKTFSQVIRIQNVCNQLYIATENPLNTDLDFGFFDQSHLIKDFNKYLLSNPGVFFDRFRSDLYN